MKKVFSTFGLLLAIATSMYAQGFKMPDYVRGSIYSIRLDAPSTSTGNFEAEIKAMTSVFDTLDYEHVYRKYNAFNAGTRLIKHTDLTDVTDDDVAAIQAINGTSKKKATQDEKYAAQLLKYLNGKNVGKAIVAKWFNAPGCTDYTTLKVDEAFSNIIKYGLLSLSEDEKAANSEIQKDNASAAMELAGQLVDASYVLVTRFDFATPAEQIQQALDEKLAPLYDKLAKVPGPMKDAVQSSINTVTETTKQTLESTIKINAVVGRSYLFKLKWMGDEAFTQKYLENPDAFAQAGPDDFQLEYITTTRGTNGLVTELAGQKLNIQKVVANKSMKVLNKNVNRLAQQYEPFAPVERLYTNDNGELYVKLGTQDGVAKDSKFTALKLDKDNNLIPGGTLTVAKGGLWNNNTEADDIEENAKDSNANLQYTLLSGKAKGCSYVKLGSVKKKK